LSADHVTRLIGIYHANGTLLGEVSYWVKARFGVGHCALCDITHGLFSKNTEWTACERQLNVPFETLHLDEQDPDLASLTNGQTPCVVAETASGRYIAVTAQELQQCDGSPAALLTLLTAVVGAAKP
jgi:hypothetical protein